MLKKLYAKETLHLQGEYSLKENFTLIYEIWLLLINYNFL